MVENKNLKILSLNGNMGETNPSQMILVALQGFKMLKLLKNLKSLRTFHLHISKSHYSIDNCSLQADFVNNFQIIEAGNILVNFNGKIHGRKGVEFILETNAENMLEALSKKNFGKFNFPMDKIKGQ